MQVAVARGVDWQEEEPLKGVLVRRPVLVIGLIAWLSVFAVLETLPPGQGGHNGSLVDLRYCLEGIHFQEFCQQQLVRRTMVVGLVSVARDSKADGIVTPGGAA